MFKKLIRRVHARVPRQGELGSALIKGAAGTTGIKAVNAAIGFATSVILARMLDASGYGTYAYVMALVGFLTIPSELGIPGLAVREVAVANARMEWGRMRGFIVRAHQVIGLVSLVLVAAGALALLAWGHHIDPMKLRCMWLGLLLVPLVALGALRAAMLRGLRKVLLGQIPEQIVRPLVLIGLVLLLPLVGRELASPAGVMVVQVIAVAAAFSVGLFLFLKHRPPQLVKAVPHDVTAIWRSSIPFGLSATMQLINGRTDVIVLGIFQSDADVGIYRVAVQMAAAVIFGQQAVNAIQGPHIAHLFARGEMDRLQKMITKSSRAVLLFALTALATVVLFGKPIIRIFFGDQYVGAYVPLVILCIGQLVNAGMGAVASLLNMTGHERDTTAIIVGGAILNVALNFCLAPVWGMTGAAIATAATLISWNLAMWQRVYRRTGIEASPFYRRRGRSRIQ